MADTVEAEAGAEARAVKVDDVILPSTEANALGAVEELALPSTLVSPVSLAEAPVLPTPAAAQDVGNRSRHSGADAEARDGEGGGSSSSSGGGRVGDKVFVGGVSWQATEADLTQFFSQYGTVIDAKIIRDSLTRRSKGYGFVTFTDEATALAVKAVGFVELLGRKCQVGDAVRGIGRGNGYPVGGGGGAPPPLPPGMVAPAIGRRKSWQMLPAPAPADRRVFVGGLSRQMDETALHQFLSQWGQVADVKIIYDSKRISKGYGFVTFVDAQSAMMVKSYGTIEFMNRQLNVGDAVRGMAGVMKGGRGGASADGASPSYERMATYGAPMQLTHGGYAMGYANFPGGYAMDMHGGQYPMAPYGVTYQQINYDGSPYGGPRFHPAYPPSPGVSQPGSPAKPPMPTSTAGLPQLPMGLTPSNSFVHLPSSITLSDGRSLKTVGSHGNLIFAMEQDDSSDGPSVQSPVEVLEVGAEQRATNEAMVMNMKNMVLSIQPTPSPSPYNPPLPPMPPLPAQPRSTSPPPATASTEPGPLPRPANT